MNTLRDPVGPESKGVYVRRRLMVLATLLAVIAFIVLIIVKPGSSGGAAKAPEVELPGEITAAEAEKQAQTNAGGVPTCKTGELVVEPITDRDSYDPGQLPLLSLSITSNAKAACQAELGTAGMRFVITSGSDEVWRSTDCQQGADQRAVILEPGETLSTEAIEWNRTRSSPDTCDADRDPVGAGGATYHLNVSAAGVPGKGTAPFLLY